MRQILLSFIGFLIAFLSICQETLADGVEIHRGPIIYVSNKDTLRLDTVFYSHDPDGDDFYSKIYPKIWSNNDAISDSINTALGYTSYYEEFGDISEFLGGYVTFDFDTWSNYLHVDLRLYHWGSGGEFIHVNHVYLDMKDGHEIKCRKFPFSALFTPDGYIEFLKSKGWFSRFYESVKYAYKEDDEEEESGDVEQYSNEIAETYSNEVLNIDYRIYPPNKIYFERYCPKMPGTVDESEFKHEPFCYMEAKFDELKPYLSRIGKKILEGYEKETYSSYAHRMITAYRLWKKVDDYAIIMESDDLMIGVNYSNHKKVKGNAFTEKGKIPVRGVYKDGYFELKIGKEKETRVFSPSVTKTSEWDNEWNGPYLYGNTTYVE